MRCARAAVHVVEPDEGYLACGMTGSGRLAAIESIARKVFAVLGLRRDLEVQTVLVTADPTREDLDPVRFLTRTARPGRWATRSPKPPPAAALT